MLAESRPFTFRIVGEEMPLPKNLIENGSVDSRGGDPHVLLSYFPSVMKKPFALTAALSILFLISITLFES